MSKKDKDKDKRKKAAGSERSSSAWIADLRPQRAERKTAASPLPVEAAPAEPDAEGPVTEGMPPTRRSSPLPDAPPDVETRIPPLPPVSLDVRSFGLPPDVAPESRPAPTEAARAPSPASVEQLEQQIRDLEARLDEMVARSGTIAAPAAPAEAPSPEVAAPSPQATARELLSSDFYLRQWGRAGMRRRAEEVDEFGLDPAYEARLLPLLDLLYKHYFRVEAEGTAHIPEEGRCLIVANHSGGPLPYDGVMLRTTLRREHPSHRELRWLAEDFVYHLPFVGTAMNRLGAVRACQENAERLLSGERLVAVFPEGVKGIGKLFKDRYRLQRFGRGGFIRLCLRTGTPIVPCAIVGAEEANPMLYRVEYLTKALGIPYLPITPTFPALGPLGLLPAPTKWKIAFGEAIRFDAYGPEAEGDEILVGRLAERVRATIQALVDRTLAGRQSVWFG